MRLGATVAAMVACMLSLGCSAHVEVKRHAGEAGGSVAATTYKSSRSGCTWIGPNGEAFDEGVYERAMDRANRCKAAGSNYHLWFLIDREMNNMGWTRVKLTDVQDVVVVPNSRSGQ